MKTHHLLLALLLGFCNFLQAQNKYGNTWISGIFAGKITFAGDTSRPNFEHYLLSSNSLCYPSVYFANANMGISDPYTGKLLFYSNAAKVYDTTQNYMQNGDSLLSPICGQNGFGDLQQQGLIIPIDSFRYYLFITNYTDKAHDSVWNQMHSAFADELRYNIIDMRANNGKGAVVLKNKKAAQNGKMRFSGMHAIKHANGRDWWLLKSSKNENGRSENWMTTFLVKPDTVEGPFNQKVSNDTFINTETVYGQISASEDGSKIIYCYLEDIYYADFDRCTGKLSNGKLLNDPDPYFFQFYGPDTTLYPNVADTSVNERDESGVCFSPNKRFIYVSKAHYIFQYDLWEPDSSLRWTTLRNGTDTCCWGNNWVNEYKGIAQGPDGRLYIGVAGAPHMAWQVIDYPNEKGLACSLRIRGFRPDTFANNNNVPYVTITELPNMPNYNLGALPNQSICWPAEINEIDKHKKIELSIWPNPATDNLRVRIDNNFKQQAYIITDVLGNKLCEGIIEPQVTNAIPLYQLSAGVYMIHCAGIGKRFVVR
jgi:hypothetical protein